MRGPKRSRACPRLQGEARVPATSRHQPSPTFIDDQANATHQMLRVVAFAETVRAIPPLNGAGTDLETFEDALRGLARLGVAQHLSRVPISRSAADLERLATAALDAIDGSPIPSAEWAPIGELLGDELAQLVGVSHSSMGRYRSGERATPDEVAARLHVVAQVVSDLAGSYNDFGIRRWFKRPRQALSGQSPSEILAGDWDLSSDTVASVRELARSLLGASIG